MDRTKKPSLTWLLVTILLYISFVELSSVAGEAQETSDECQVLHDECQVLHGEAQVL